jgi:RluA family pseudouridine synthase
MPADRPKRLYTVAAQDPRGLAAFLQARLAIGAPAAQKLLAEGAVFVGLKRAQLPPPLLSPGARVTVYSAAPAAPAARPAAPALQIALTDDDILVVDKPAGLCAQPGRRGGPSLLALLPPHAVLLHRLDAEASGLLLCARTPAAAAALQHALGNGEVTREYLAVVSGTPPESGRIDLRIGACAQSGPMSALRQCYPVNSLHGQPATTLFRTAGRSGRGAAAPMMLLVQLLSGRTHQIRVHLAALGYPILGDSAYGGPAASRLLLHAVRLRFRHPRTGQLCQVVAPPPTEFGWPTELGPPGRKDRPRSLAHALDAAFAAPTPAAPPAP